MEQWTIDSDSMTDRLNLSPINNKVLSMYSYVCLTSVVNEIIFYVSNV